jgi:vacuolar protein sorting-associated protein 45
VPQHIMAASRASKMSAAESLDVMQGVAQYVDRALDQIGGMKVLLLDKETTGIISMVYSQSQILEREVYLTKLLEPPHERMMHLKAVVLVRPTAANFRLLVSELADPHFGEYHLLFTNMVREDMLQQVGGEFSI